MKNYKLGNQVTVIIRSYCGDTSIGNQSISYANQPYTIIKSADASLSFKNISSTAKTNFNYLVYTHTKPSQLLLSNVTLNDKILNLMFHKNNGATKHYFSKIENVVSSNGYIYFGLSDKNLRDIFIYDNSGNCKHLDKCNSNEGYAIGTDNQSYLVCYQYESINSFSLDQNDNQYFTIDLLLTSNQNNNEEYNKEDNTINSTIHLAKCGLEIDSNMSFSQNSNAVDLKFIVLDSNTEENYITLE